VKSRLFLCVDGQNVSGPFSLEELRLAVARHEVSKATLACEEGTEAWQPLGDLRPEAFKRAEKKASPKQKALLAYLGYPSPETASSAEATAWLDAALADKKNERRLEKWTTDRLKLHPDLYAEEVEAAREEAEWEAEEAELEREYAEAEEEAFADLKPGKRGRAKKPKKKRGCLGWIVLIVVALFGLSMCSVVLESARKVQDGRSTNRPVPAPSATP
jgi:hypothetical protein